jgi:cytochrome c-type biogenesis protein CcmF
MGMMLAHVGVAVFIFGVTMVKGYEIERDVRMSAGDTTALAGYVFTFKGIQEHPGPNYRALQATIDVTKDGAKVTEMRPEKRVYRVQRNPMTEAAIRTGFFGDIYVSLGEEVDGGAWIVRIYIKPFVDWIWGGCLVMALGGLLAATDRRYRARAPAGAPTSDAAARGVSGATAAA